MDLRQIDNSPSDYVIQNGKPFNGQDGAYYHYSNVVTLVKGYYENKINEEIEELKRQVHRFKTGMIRGTEMYHVLVPEEERKADVDKRVIQLEEEIERINKSAWININERIPQKWDTDIDDNLFAWDGVYKKAYKCSRTDLLEMKARFTHWMPINPPEN